MRNAAQKLIPKLGCTPVPLEAAAWGLGSGFRFEDLELGVGFQVWVLKLTG